MFKVDLPEPGPIYTYTTCCECDKLRARIVELEADLSATNGCLLQAQKENKKFEAEVERLRKGLEYIKKECHGFLTEDETEAINAALRREGSDEVKNQEK